MNSSEFVFSQHAVDSLKAIIEDLQQVSLLSAEKVRAKIMHRLHLIQHQPQQSSKKIETDLDKHIRVAAVLNYKIFYSVEENRISVLEILLDKEIKNG
jgi:plasmid stabilization system protein ParE